MTGARIVLLVGALVAVGWLAWDRVSAPDATLTATALSNHVPRLAVATTGIVGATFLLASAWAALAAAPDTPRARGMLTLVFGATWLGRYLPGKVPGLAGRVYVAHRLGFPVRPLVVGTGVMTAIEILVASLVGVVLLSVVTGTVVSPSPSVQLASAVGALFAVLAALAIAIGIRSQGGRWMLQRLDRLRDELRAAPSRPRVIRAVVFAFLSRLISGMSLFLVVGVFEPVTWSHLALHTGALSGAAVVSMVVAVAPGGLGVREGLIMALLAPVHGADSAAVAAVLFRALSVVADVLSLLGALTLSLLLYRIPLHAALHRDRGEVAAAVAGAHK